MTDNIASEIIRTINTPLGAVRISITANGSAAVVVSDMPKVLENGMSIEHSKVALITVVPNSKALSIKIFCELIGSSIQGTKCTGQYLDCIEWLSDEWHMTIGTEDTEILLHRYPSFKINEEPYPVEYDESGITIDLEALNVHKDMSLHVIVSAKSLPEERDSTAWFFAGISHEKVQKAISSIG